MKRISWNWNVVWVAFGIYIYLGTFQEIVHGLLRNGDLSDVLTPWNILLTLTGALPFMSFSIVLYALLRKFYRQVSIPKLVAILLFGSFGVIALRYFIEELVLRWITGHGNYKDGTPLWYYFLDNTYHIFMYGSVGVVFYFIQVAFQAEREKSQLEIENKTTQLQFLRNQVNPHFLFNSLNNIYSLVYQKSENALPSVSKLSKLLRYSLYESESEVSVDKEIEHIQNYMDLEQLRRSEPIEVVTNLDPEAWTAKIPPYLLLPFVENAYKHGDLHNSERPITIDLKINDHKLLYEVRNVIIPKEKDATGGIGLPNIKKRLELLYGNQHFLDIQEKEDLFTIKLAIPL